MRADSNQFAIPFGSVPSSSLEVAKKRGVTMDILGLETINLAKSAATVVRLLVWRFELRVYNPNARWVELTGGLG